MQCQRLEAIPCVASHPLPRYPSQLLAVGPGYHPEDVREEGRQHRAPKHYPSRSQLFSADLKTNHHKSLRWLGALEPPCPRIMDFS